MKKTVLILFFAAIFLFSFYIFNGSVLCADDIYFEFLLEGVKPVKNFTFGTWLMHFINIFLYYIPFKLSINIQDWNAFFGSILKSGIITLMFVYLYKFINFKNTKPYIPLITVSILYFLFFIWQYKTSFTDFIITQGFYRFIAVSCLYEIFLYYCFKLYTGSRVNIKMLAALAFLTASSSEHIAAISAVSCTAMFIAAYFQNRDKIKIYFLILAAVISGAVLISLTYGFSANIERKLGGYSIDAASIISTIPKYTIIYIKRLIYNYLPFYILEALCFFAVLKAGISSVKKEAVFCCIILSGILIFAYSLIILGKTSYSGTFWIIHSDLYTIVQIIYMTEAAVSINAVLRVMPDKFIPQTVLILFLTAFFTAAQAFHPIATLKTTLGNIRTLSYIRDKMRLFYSYKDIPNVMPQYAKFSMFWAYISDKKAEPYEDKWITFLETQDNEERVFNLLQRDYFSIVYSTDVKMEKLDAAVNKDAIDYFRNQGGSLDEIKTGKYKFADLADKNFVLQN